MIALMLTACNKERDLLKDDWQDNVPGLENGVDTESGKNYTTYMGHELPESNQTLQNMMDVLHLVSMQQGEIDDEKFVAMFTSAPLRTESIFMADVVEGTKCAWYGQYDYVGISYGGTIQADDNGKIISIFSPTPGDLDIEYHMEMWGIKGFYSTYFWEYNEDSNILLSSYSEGGEKLVAELLYFDGTQAVMLGKIAGISNTGKMVDGSGREIITKYELHHLIFDEGGKLSIEEYAQTFMYEWLQEICDVEAQMESIMLNHGDYDVEALAEELNDSKWRECGVLRYFDNDMSHVEYADAWNGQWNAAGGVFSDFTLNADGRGEECCEPMLPPFELVTEPFSWRFDTESRRLTITYDDYGTKEVIISAYWSDTDSKKYMVWDSGTDRIVLQRVE
jgi:hypothetical protein